MDLQKRKAITDEVAALVKKHYYLTHKGEENYIGAVLLDPDVQQGYEELAGRLLRELPEYRERFAFEDISQRLKSVVTETVRSGEYSKSEVLMNQLWERLENADERKLCYIPLTGVKLNGPELEIGKFRLRQMDVAAIGEAILLMEASIDRTLSSTAIKETVKEQECKEMMEHLSDSVCLVVPVSADTLKADQISMRDAATLLDLLRFTIPVLYPNNIAGVGLKGDGRAGMYRRYTLPVGHSDGQFKAYWTGPFGDFEINEKAMEAMKALGVLKLADALRRSLSDLEVAVLRAIHWFAESQVQRTVDYELVSLVVALESLFELDHQSKRKTDTICEATAVLLDSEETTRITLFRLVRNACFYRGEVVHQGDDAAEYTEIVALRQIVHRLIAVVCQRSDEFRASKDVLVWVQQQGADLTKKAGWRKPSLVHQRVYHRRRTPHGIL